MLAYLDPDRVLPYDPQTRALAWMLREYADALWHINREASRRRYNTASDLEHHPLNSDAWTRTRTRARDLLTRSPALIGLCYLDHDLRSPTPCAE